ncbi:unnamed protein product [Arabidopsis lyrata]|uniref:Uncharacterized protein n=1 Tax=Arabidopsis lyrata subsp. lyrata TaxID=81972 RepID=D7L0D2_ARALL|nr:hypothetical protein ARALYDRAFT_896296 [Arabidopsis lyrata subsp. lyrata]CAH8259118.1 unnamed protein product [Arabidopsis lyrata]
MNQEASDCLCLSLKKCLFIAQIKEQLDADSVGLCLLKDFGKSSVNRQMMMYKAICEEELQNVVHAVDQMTTKTPSQITHYLSDIFRDEQVLDYVANLSNMKKEELAELSYVNSVRLFSYTGSKFLTDQ